MSQNENEPVQLNQLALDVAQALLAGFDKHYRLFRQMSAQAKDRFEAADWHGQQKAQRDRIEYYDLRVADAAQLLERTFHVSQFSSLIWQEIKLQYIGLLTDHLQPELAETFFNSVTTKLLHRSYFHNDFIFVRPAIATEYIENISRDHRSTFRSYYPSIDNLLEVGQKVIEDFGLKLPFSDLMGDLTEILTKVEGLLLEPLDPKRLRANFQIQVLSSLFYRNKGAYVVGRIINGYHQMPFALPILHNEENKLYIDALLHGEDDLLMLFSFARAYFMVDMDIPSGYVQFLRNIMPRKPKSEIYSALGLHKQGKNMFYRDFISHLRQSSDMFRIAPGIKGMVMLVFDLPSFPFVFKCIKDFYPAPKETTRELIKSKYLLVKQHDRVGRMADTLEFSNVAFPRHRFTPELLAELKHFCPSLLEEDDDVIVIKHVYIERRMIPLNIYIQEAESSFMEDAVVEYGNAIKDLVAANIFPGDMLWKNFGVMRQGKVVFYDYDEIEYITDCNFRQVPEPRNEEEEMSGEVWYHVGPKDVFPETFGPFLLGNAKVRAIFLKHHADLLSADFWQSHKTRIAAGQVLDVFPYEQNKRLRSYKNKHMHSKVN